MAPNDDLLYADLLLRNVSATGCRRRTRETQLTNRRLRAAAANRQSTSHHPTRILLQLV